MSGRLVIVIAAALGLWGASVAAQGDSKAQLEVGKKEYLAKCAACHGKTGKGDGPQAASLKQKPGDLTTYAKRNGGKYPADTVARIVDGRKPPDGRGGPDMPVWGDAFKNSETGFDEGQVKQKIQSVVDYLKTLQQE